MDEFMTYLRTRDDGGFYGTFDDWLREVGPTALMRAPADHRVLRTTRSNGPTTLCGDNRPSRTSKCSLGAPTNPTAQQPSTAHRRATRTTCTCSRMTSRTAASVVLGVMRVAAACIQASRRVLGAESLLAALEACGVDNARIEMEGGNEVPVIDGSALGWLVALEEHGLKEAIFGKRERAKRVCE